MAWRIAKSLATLRDEVNQRWPDRNKASDGVIGDAAHAASSSDHNPNAQGVVCAFDITHDPAGPDGSYLAELLRTHRHPDLKYVIWDGRLFSAYPRGGALPFEWRPYGGADPHTNHVHVSVGTGIDGKSQPPYDDTTSWGVLTPINPTASEDEVLDPNDPTVKAILETLSRIDVRSKENETRGVETNTRLAALEAKVNAGGGGAVPRYKGTVELTPG